MSASPRGAGFDWKVHFTEGLWAIQADEAPDAYLWSVRSFTAPYDPKTFNLHTTTNNADLRFFSITCYDPHGTTTPYVFSRGEVDLTTGKASWSTPVRSYHAGLPPPPELYWPPEHDIAEAAAVFDRPLREVIFDSQSDTRQVYSFLRGIYIEAEVDANTLKIQVWA